MMENSVQLIIKASAAKATAEIKKFTGGAERHVKDLVSRSTPRFKVLKTATEGVGKAVKWLKARLLSLKTVAITALAGWGLKRLAEGFIETGSGMDQMKMSLDTITKGRGEEWFQRLNEWALKMPVNTQKAIQSFTMMTAMGLKPTIEQMTTLAPARSAARRA